jgi:YD repeat-containing protein
MTESVDSLAQHTAFTYDALNRLLTKTTRVGAPDQEVTTNTYDQVRSGFYNIGHLTTAANNTATITYDQDAAGRLAKQTWAVVGLSGTKIEETGYHAGGQVLWKNWPDGTSTGSSGTPWTYDNTGKLSAIPSLITTTSYNAAGQVTHIGYQNGVATDNTYDAGRNWLMKVETKLSATLLQSVTYTRDAAGRALTRVVAPNAESWTYTYDKIDRLLSAANASDGTSSRTFAYDDAGNMTSNSGVGTYTYPAQGPSAVRPHAVTAAGSNSYAYDDAGGAPVVVSRELGDRVWGRHRRRIRPATPNRQP